MPQELIDWAASRQRDTAALLEQAEAEYTACHGYPPTPRVRSRLMKRAAVDSRPAKKVPLPLAELRRRWRAEAIRRLGLPSAPLSGSVRGLRARTSAWWEVIARSGDGRMAR